MAVGVAVASMSLLKPSRCLGITNHHRKHDTCPRILKPLPSLTLEDFAKGSAVSKMNNLRVSREGMAMVCAVLSSLSCNASMAAQQVADTAEGDSRGLLLIAPIIPAILWALFNISEPAMDQINRMRSR